MNNRCHNVLASLASQVQMLQNNVPLAEPVGRVVEATASGYKVQGLSNFVKLGSLIKFHCEGTPVLAEIVRVEQEVALVRTFDNGSNISLATLASPVGALAIRPSPGWKGRMIDALGRPVDGGADLILGKEPLSVDNTPPSAMIRRLVNQPMRTGIRVIDIFTPVCSGQRIGIFAGSGVGKSTILSMLSSATGFDMLLSYLWVSVDAMRAR